MKFERLRLSGFKTFVEPVEITIAPGLTGIVGPNGCGKSNLVEALRWVMGETSSKSLRGAGMEDVIFAGSTTRPERNHAEVSIRIGEVPAGLPGHLAGAEAIEISRRILREQGSTYRMNGREVRARDVQILFADAASGARSPSLVRQGQIAELIAAKPQLRRRILEDAAGVAGLHTRRHEAELRLKGAEENLARLADFLLHYERQRGDLKRQARQAERYKTLSAQIRALETDLLAAAYATARHEAAEAQAALEAAIRGEAMAMVAQGEAERARALSEHEAQAARQVQGEAQRELAARRHERAALDAELEHLRLRLHDLVERRAEAERDAQGAERLSADAAAALVRLRREEGALQAQGPQIEQEALALAAGVAAAAQARAEAEAGLAGLQIKRAEGQAERRSAGQRLAEAEARLKRLEVQKAGLEQELGTARAADSDLPRLAALEAALAKARAGVASAVTAHAETEQLLLEARGAEQACRPKLAEVERQSQQLETEARTIRKLVDHPEPGLWTPAVDRIRVVPGFEAALAAALGDDLDAAIEPIAPRHWAELAMGALPALPEASEPLLRHVEAPGALHARLSQIGVVEAARGEALAALLKPGQRLVSRAGDLWRWDGFASRAESLSPAARRLAERNRLADLDAAAQDARSRRDAARAGLEKAKQAQRQAIAAETGAREALRRAQAGQEDAARALAAAQAASEAQRIRFQAGSARLEAIAGDIEEARARCQEAQSAVAACPAAPEDEGVLEAARARLEAARAAENDARAAASRNQAFLDASRHRQAGAAREIAEWTTRSARAEADAAALAARLARLAEEEARLSEQPDALAARRLGLCEAIERAETAARAAEDALAGAEAALRLKQEGARATLAGLADARALRARLEARQEGANARLAETIRTIEAHIDAPASSLPGAPEVATAQIQGALDRAKGERDGLGAVNLRAEMELCEIEQEHARLDAERGDVERAVQTLRRAIEQLNAEGRARLRAAFDKVDAAFRELFTRLFGGGTARLQLVEADDPLDAGLEILAHPPGKKPQLLSLLSGGEQALTATALIFAVFLSNPAPICVLDEVDAPLDDANVERLCDLLAEMARRTETRFLVITHNPISMARMDRLYGVTMVERGVSEVVSVDLVAAEAIAQAG